MHILEFVPEKVGSLVILNVMQKETERSAQETPAQAAADAFVGSDYVIAIHNWFIGTNLKYLAFDLQDEKEVPKDFLEELLQLMRRVRIPFFFAGVMDRPRVVLKSYAYASKFPIFENTDQLATWLNQNKPELGAAAHETIQFGSPIDMVRTRLNGRVGEEGEDSAGDVDD